MKSFFQRQFHKTPGHVVGGVLKTRLRSHPQHSKQQKREMTSNEVGFPTQAEIVICGSGLVGNSVAYHLVKSGKRDVVILQLPGHILNSKGTISSNIGAPISLFRASDQEEKLSDRSIALYKSLEALGYDIGLQTNGGLYLAQEMEMMSEFRRRVDLFRATSNINMEILSPNDIQQRFPLINIQGLKGGVLVHEDVVANPFQISQALTNEVLAEGGRVVPNCHFNKVLVEDGRVCGVETLEGTIKCERFVNCAGWFAWEYGQKQTPSVRIPLHPVEKHYLRTMPSSQELPKILPTITDMNSYIYTSKLPDNSFVIGANEKFAKAVFTRQSNKTLSDQNKLI